MRTAILIIGLALLWAGDVFAQDNRVPLSYRELRVNVVETYGNNNTRRYRGAKIVVEPKEEIDDQFVNFPLKKTTGAQGLALFPKIPPTNLSKTAYTVTLTPRNNCGEAQTKDFRMGTAPKKITFKLNCGALRYKKNKQTAYGNDGHELIVKIKQNTGTRGAGLWVYLIDPDGNEYDKKRTGGNKKAVFRNVPSLEKPYQIKVKAGAREVASLDYTMPKEDALTTVAVN